MSSHALILLGLFPQNPAPKPAGFLPETEQWIREHAHFWSQGGDLGALLAGKQSCAIVAPPACEPARRCAELLLARAEPPFLGVCASWDEGRALDSWLREGKGAAPALLDKSLLERARAFNADEKHAKKLRAAGVDYRAAREEALAFTELVRKLDPAVEQRTSELLGPFRQTGPDGKHRYASTDSNWRFAVQQLLSDFQGQAAERREEWEKLVGADGFADYLRNLRRLQQAEAEVSKPDEFRRGEALCQNAAAARDALAPGCALALFAPPDAALEARDAHEALGAETLVVLVLQSKDDPDAQLLARVQPSGMLDLRELPKEGKLAAWFEAHLRRRADLVLWAPAP